MQKYRKSARAAATAVMLGAGLASGMSACAAGDATREAIVERLTANMFVAADTDAFDPGIAVGSSLPALRAMHAGKEVTGLDGMAGTRGTLLVVNRSVDW